ncbi:MAG: tRNA (adenosine(37)-N6)-threonylcarbamoyltransferase complex transferase subunit TsaD [Bacteroidetes bacterium]|nr:MAG: tRNA (adenosine(37)-N6)-threonylcarbamoyltransferase complex transferase subunit TsaD [Bacteroidota bacterium]RLD75843.1 MAG: tRNA (adenosine(37)-N6)-threonylcarbamoyltransferase complex transferase subunit TsaD [Bacteroidota bacterium]
MSTLILGIESSCDDTSAAVTEDTKILANIVAGQEVHKNYGGVVPELASRAHQQNIIPVIDQALKQAKIKKNQLDAVAFTRGPGLLGSLLVGTSFAKAFALAAEIPIIEVDHLQAHILAHFITGDANQKVPGFPFICLTVSGGHTQIIKVDDPHTFTLLGQTIDDAAGEAFDKAAKIMGLPYPGGPYIDKLAGEGNPQAYKFPKPRIKGLDYSFSGLKTSFLYTVRDKLREDASFIEKEKANLAASIQFTIIDVLLDKLTQAAEMTGISDIALAGGVSANSGLRKALKEKGEKTGWNIFIPGFEFTTDNAAMISIAGYFKYLRNDFASQDITPYTRSNF